MGYAKTRPAQPVSQTEKGLKHAIAGALLVSFLAGAAGCEQKTPVEEAADKVDESLEDTADAVGDATRDAADEVSDAAEEAKEEVEEKTEDK